MSFNPTICVNFFNVASRKLQAKIGSPLLNKMENSVLGLGEDVLEKVARESDGIYTLKDQINIRSNGRKGGEYFKSHLYFNVPLKDKNGADASLEKLIKVRTATRGKQSPEAFTQEKLSLIAKFKGALEGDVSEHVSVNFATKSGGKITDHTVGRYTDADAAFKSSDNQGILDALKDEANNVETKILRGGQFRIRQTVQAVKDGEGKITTPARKYTVKLAQGKQSTEDYVDNGIQVAKRIQDRPETIGKEFTVANTTTKTSQGRVPSAQKIKQYDEAVETFNSNEESIKKRIRENSEYAEGNYRRRLTGKNRYVVESAVKGSNERYVVKPHKESLPDFVHNANEFADRVAFSNRLSDKNNGILEGVSISPRFMLKHDHVVEDRIQSFDEAWGIFKEKIAETSSGRVYAPGNDGLALRIKGNGKFSIKDVVKAKNEEPAGSLKSLKIKQGNQSFSDFIKNGIEFASLKKEYNQYMSESFGVKGNWLTGNRVKAEGLDLRNEAINFFEANSADLQKLQKNGHSFKLRKHGKIALQYGENSTWLDAPSKSLSQRNGEGLTGFLERGLKEADAFVAQQNDMPEKSVLGRSAATRAAYREVEKAVKKNKNRVEEGYSLIADKGRIKIKDKETGKTLETLKPKKHNTDSIKELIEAAVQGTKRYADAEPEKPNIFKRIFGLKKRVNSSSVSSSSVSSSSASISSGSTTSRSVIHDDTHRDG